MREGDTNGDCVGLNHFLLHSFIPFLFHPFLSPSSFPFQANKTHLCRVTYCRRYGDCLNISLEKHAILNNPIQDKDKRKGEVRYEIHTFFRQVIRVSLIFLWQSNMVFRFSFFSFHSTFTLQKKEIGNRTGPRRDSYYDFFRKQGVGKRREDRKSRPNRKSGCEDLKTPFVPSPKLNRV